MGTLLLVLHLVISDVTVVDGNGLYEMCSGDRFGCLMYVFGYLDGAHRYGREFCFPTSTLPEQLRKVIWQYLNTHPADRDEAAGILIDAAIDAAWPCDVRKNHWHHE